MHRDEALGRLLRSREPSVRWKARVRILNEDPDGASGRRLRAEVRRSARSRRLIRVRNRPGRSTPPGVYHKWLGAHRAMASLADLGYPPDAPELRPELDRCLAFWLDPEYGLVSEMEPGAPRGSGPPGVPRIAGRFRRCASQHGNALAYATTLGAPEESRRALAAHLLRWQWPDGGWNCDRRASAKVSSFHETLLPMVGLYRHSEAVGDPGARAAAERASEVFLRRALFRRVADGTVIRPRFLRTHYPRYWVYDVLGALVALAPMGRLSDPRCGEALDWLEAKERPGGGWGMDDRYYDLPGEPARRGRDRVLWGPLGGRENPWVTADALYVLRAAGRYDPSPR